MAKRALCFRLFILLSLLAACSKSKLPEDPDVWNKVQINLSRLDQNGLRGPENGKVAANYELCIPGNTASWKAIQKIDQTATLQKNSPGRSGCGQGTWLVIGSTNQKNYKRVIYELARLSYVKEIKETFFE